MAGEKNITRIWIIKIKLDTVGMERTDSIAERGGTAGSGELGGVHFS